MFLMRKRRWRQEYRLTPKKMNELRKAIKQEMENITEIELKVPLIAEVGVGDNWGDAH